MANNTEDRSGTAPATRNPLPVLTVDETRRLWDAVLGKPYQR